MQQQFLLHEIFLQQWDLGRGQQQQHRHFRVGQLMQEQQLRGLHSQQVGHSR
jgi:hypothetical protein